MSNYLKTLVAVCTVVCGTYLVSAQEALKVAPGSALYIYNLSDSVKPAPEAEPISVIVDSSAQFSKLNLSKNKETYKFTNQELFLVWTGYISITQKGIYTFSMSYNATNSWMAPSVVFQINGKDFLRIIQSRKENKLNDSLSLALEKGNYEIKLICRATGVHEFSVKMWNKLRPLKKFEITPASMVHAE